MAAQNAKLAQAVADARAQLPRFWKAFDSPANDEDRFAVAFQVEDRNGSEPVWLNDLSHKDGKVQGRVIAEPRVVKSVKLGGRIEIPEGEITDWVYWRDDKMVGNFTTRALLDSLSPAEAEHMRSQLVDP